MILCLDAGNSRLKWGLHNGERWLEQGALAYGSLEIGLAQLPAPASRVIGCNVAGESIRQRIEAVFANRNAPSLRWLTSAQSACGVINGYQQPAQLGTDRWAALIGARALSPGPSIVVMVGTATTIDQLDTDGVFRGGLILPGLDLMRRALAKNTADLPFANGTYQDTPRNTEDAIVSGTLHATLGAIERMRLQLGPDTRVVLSGGAAPFLLPRCAAPVTHIENLVLEGLFCVEMFDTIVRAR